MFTKLFIDRPKLSLVISLAISLLGVLCIFRLPIAEYPEIAPPCIYVLAQYPGASSQVMAETVASIIEEEVNGIEDMIYFNSTSENSGSYYLTLYFKPLTDSNIAQVNVQNAVQRAQTKLPKEVTSIGVKVAKRSTDMIGLYVFTTEDEEKFSHLELANYVRMNVRDRFARIQGVSDTEIQGERNYSMRIWLDTLKMAGLGLEAEDIVGALQSQNIQAAIGTLGSEESSDYLQLKIDAPGRRRTEEEFAAIIVKTTDDGRQVTLGDVARVELGAELYMNNSFWGGKPSVSVQIYRQTGANAIDVINECNAALDDIRKRLPEGVEGTLGYDPTLFIRKSIEEIAFTLVLTLVLVVLVTYVFLQDWRATIVPAVAIPVSLLGTFFVMSLLGFTINVLSMFGLILVVGLLVDDGVIVVENATRLIEQEHLTPYEAAVKSMKQTTGAILASTFVMVAIFAPLSFFGGIVGTIYMQFSVTMCVAIIFSAINALTLSPALCALLLRPHGEHKKNFIFKFFDWGISTTKNVYLTISKAFVRRSLLTCVVIGVLAWGNSLAFKQLSEGFIPNEDKGALLCEILLPPGATLKRTNDALEQFQDIAHSIPGVQNVVAVSGFSLISGMCENVGLGIIQLDDWGKRRTPETQITAIRDELMARCAEIPQGTVTAFQPPAIMGLGATGGVSFMLCNQNGTPKLLESDMGKLLGLLNNKELFPEVAYAFSSYTASTPQLFLDVDSQAAAALSSSKGEVYSALQSKIASFYVNDFNSSGYSFKVKVQADEQERSNVGNIDELTVRNHLGQQIPLSELATMRYELGAQRITRFNQAMCVPINVITTEHASTGDVMRKIEQVVFENFPKEYQVEWTDLSYHQRGNEGKLGILLMLALAFGYLFLAAKYESWTVPIPVLMYVLFATFGAMIAMKICHMTLDVYAQLSLIMLLGLASKISILTVEFSRQERESGVAIEEAALNGAKQRYRAIMMTAGCFIAGVIPLMVATGAGSVSRRIVGVCTGWGMISATVLGIGFLPPFYAMIQRWREYVNKHFWGRFVRSNKEEALAMDKALEAEGVKK
ncbi:MAG: efflux RND transporter permease subunit [Planctomycetia bacterium]|nr:efflux RND transporter permease subunit [Planctomycetia bacterium]